ncbi:MAG: hypothetical protein LBP74_10385 [Treponema sp.]|jgi:hypothetical protein|nr:hypothetical protein [Treponema sp.]
MVSTPPYKASSPLPGLKSILLAAERGISVIESGIFIVERGISTAEIPLSAVDKRISAAENRPPFRKIQPLMHAKQALSGSGLKGLSQNRREPSVRGYQGEEAENHRHKGRREKKPLVWTLHF